MKLRYFTIAMTVLFSLAVALYVTAPVGQLRTAAAYRPDGSGEDRVAGLAVVENLRLSETPEMFLLGLLFREDKKFFEHRGFDFEEITNSIRDYLFRGRRLRGASTISQQLARTLLLNRERSLRRKLLEAVYTVKLERYFSKGEILILYVNNIEWGVGIYGLRQAAEHYFGKSPSDLSDTESAFLVSIIPNPRRLSRTSYPGRLPGSMSASMRRRVSKLLAVYSATQSPHAASTVRGVSAAEHARAMQLLGGVQRLRAVPVGKLEPQKFANSFLAAPLVKLFNSLRRWAYFRPDESCLGDLRASGMSFRVVLDGKPRDACPLRNVVRMLPAPGGLIRRPLYMTCRLALSLHRFEDDVLQPTAMRYFGQPVVQMKELGVRNCRTVDGYQELLSEHAFANAIDVSSFVLRNGTVIDVAKDWNGASLQSAFLRDVASDACKVFRTVLTPGFDDRHDDHLHFDMALIGSCRASKPVPGDAH